MEFLDWTNLSNALLLSLGIYDDVKTVLAEMGLDLDALIDEENDPGPGAMEVLVARGLFFLDSGPRWPTGDAATVSATTTECSGKIF